MDLVTILSLLQGLKGLLRGIQTGSAFDDGVSDAERDQVRAEADAIRQQLHTAYDEARAAGPNEETL